MKFRLFITFVVLVGILAFSVYAFKVKEGWVDSQAEKDLIVLQKRIKVYDRALLALPKEQRTPLLLAEVMKGFPDEKSEDVAALLYIELKETKEGDTNASTGN